LGSARHQSALNLASHKIPATLRILLSNALFMEPTQKESKPETQTSKDYSTRMFMFALELIPYFGIPAIIGLYANKKIIGVYPDTSFPITAVIFLFTYILSWVLVVKRYQSIKRQIKK
jgi:ABC-type transport system involved in Fe-S cluster assembly fused permease/ATPase subunit